jgi:hypothetical protein
VKTIQADALPQGWQELIRQGLEEEIVILLDGQPVGFLGGIDEEEEDDAPFWVESDSEIWAELERRRNSGKPTIPLQDVLEKLQREEG